MAKYTGRDFISGLKLYSDYFKWLDKENRYESWEDACDDILQMHLNKYGSKIKPLIDEIKPNLYNKELLASQRNLQFREKQIKQHNMKIYNCVSTYCNSPDVFSKSFYILLCGSGLGISLRNKFVSRLPNIDKRINGTKTFVIPDSIEGWADAMKILISSYCKHPSLLEEYYNCQIRFDYSQIREKGSFISGGFKAPGHEGLKKSIEKIEQLLDKELGEKSSVPFRSIIAYDVLMHCADAVLSGGVRRSATLVLMDEDDEELINAKMGNWWVDNPQRARSNNSVAIHRGNISKEKLKYLIELNQGRSDLGFIFVDDEDTIVNPCVSGRSLINTPNGLYFPKTLQENNKIKLNGEIFNSKPFWQTATLNTLEFKTNTGRKIKVTDNHLMLLGEEQEYLPAGELKVGQTLTISNNQNELLSIDSNTDDFKKGYLLGSFLVNGNFSENSCQIKFLGENNSVYHNQCIDYINDLKWTYDTGEKHLYKDKDEEDYAVLNCNYLYDFIKNKDISVIDNKRLTKELLEGSFDYISGIIAGYFDANGIVLINKQEENSVRIYSSDLNNLEVLQIALNSLGVYSKIYNNRNKDSHELVITEESMRFFSNNVPFLNIEKKQKLETLLKSYTRDFYKTSFIEEIIEINACEKEDVWDCSVEVAEAFDCDSIVVHNCAEIQFSFYNQIENKDESAQQACNLCEINASACCDQKGNFSEDKFYELCRSGSIIGTLQAGYVDFPYLGKQTEDIIKGEALLGVSITGWMTRPELFNAEILQKGAKIVKDTNEEVAKLIGINPSARTTTVKPSGNASVILKTTSGIHPEHSKNYFRLMQLNKESETAKFLEVNYPERIEESKWSNTNSDYVVYSPCESNNTTLFKKDMMGVKHLELIKLVQENWIVPGKNEELCYNKNTCHSVSNTVILDDIDEVTDYLFENQNYFAAVSFINGDKDYVQAPYTSVLMPDELLEKYGKGVMFASGLIVDGLHYFDDDLWGATDIILQNIEVGGTREKSILRKDWVRRVKKFAKNYFKNDLELAIYCLKDVHLYHKWEVIMRNFKPVDFQSILTKPNYIDIDTTSGTACAGGSCEI